MGRATSSLLPERGGVQPGQESARRGSIAAMVPAVSSGGIDPESAGWLSALTGTGAERETALRAAS